MFNKTTLATVITAALLSTPTIAKVEAETHLAQTIIVTATRTAQTADETLASVTVIERQQIEQSQQQSLPELLSSLVGIDIAISGGLGKTSSIYMRGTGSQNILVLIDGIKIGSATLGTAAIQDIPLSHIERIEVVRGPRSSLYGSEAIGGVIQIFTKKGLKKSNLNASIGAGSNNTRELSMAASGQAGNSNYSFAISRLTTEGIDATVGGDLDKDGYKRSAVSLAFGHQFSDYFDIQANLLHTVGTNEYDSWSADKEDVQQQTVGVTANLIASDSFDMKFQLSRSLDFRDNLTSSGAVDSRFNTTRVNTNWLSNLVINENQLLTIGIDLQNDRIKSTTNYDETSRYNVGQFAQYQTETNGYNILLGIRNDHNQQFGSYVTKNIAIGHQLTSTSRAYISAGSAFNAPTFNALYYPGSGNADLKPEESTSYEIGLENSYFWGSWGINAYHTKTSNMIEWWETAPYTWSPLNIDTEINGLEIDIAAQFNQWAISGGIALLDPQAVDYNKVRPRIAKRSANLNIDRNFGKLSTGINIIIKGPRFNDGNNNKKLSGYQLVSLHTRYQLTEQLNLKAKIDNLTDEQYQTASGYNTDGRAFYISLTYSN